jgi:hypothetical protein
VAIIGVSKTSELGSSPRGATNKINMDNNLEERDKSEWVKCKDLIENYEYISISPKSLSVIIGIKEEDILKSLENKTLVNNRFIVTKFISDEKK